MASTRIGKQAVVIGAGIGAPRGAAARAARLGPGGALDAPSPPPGSAHPPGTATARSARAQARHVHALLVSGQRAIGELFPGFERDLARAGAVPLRAGLDIRTERPGYDSFPQRDLGWSSYAVSRPTIEHIVRRRVESLPNTT